MLTVTRLKLHNICQYDDIDVPIETGLMAICGRNGSGKSTLLRGLMYGLTGLVDGSWGTQQNLQKDGAATPGYVVVSLKDDSTNKEYTIKRYSTAGTKFHDSVEEFYKGETKEVALRRKTVDAFLGELYGIPCALLFQLCWGRQGQLDMLLTAPAAYVSTFLSGVWNTKYLETLRDRLKGAIDKVAVMADPMRSIEETAKERLGLENALPGLVEKEKDLQLSIETKGKELEDLQKQVSQSSVEDAKKAAVLNERLSQCGVNISAALQSLNNADLDAVKDKTIEELGETLNAAQRALTEHSAAATQATQAVIAIGNSYQRLSDTLVDLQTKLNDVRTEKQRIEALVDDNSGTCAFCGHIIDNKEVYIERAFTVLGYQSATGHNAFLERETLLSDEILATDRRMQDLLAGKEAKVKEAKELAEQVKLDQDDINKANQKLQTGKALREYAKWHDLEEQIRAELTKLDKPELDDLLNQRIHMVAGEIESLEYAYKQVVRDKAAAEARVEALTRYIDRLEAEKEQYDVNCSARSMLVLLRDVFSQQRAQARYFASKTGELNEHLAAFMELTGMPFNLRLDPDTRLFSYTSEGGFEHPTAHLSGAQKNISAVALQMALVEVIRPNINLFLFDEPSESLDVENKIVMADLFQRMNRLLPSIGGTMLIVSRDQQLIDSCECIIDINQKENNNNAET